MHSAQALPAASVTRGVGPVPATQHLHPGLTTAAVTPEPLLALPTLQAGRGAWERATPVSCPGHGACGPTAPQVMVAMSAPYRRPRGSTTMGCFEITATSRHRAGPGHLHLGDASCEGALVQPAGVWTQGGREGHSPQRDDTREGRGLGSGRLPTPGRTLVLLSELPAVAAVGVAEQTRMCPRRTDGPCLRKGQRLLRACDTPERQRSTATRAPGLRGL